MKDKVIIVTGAANGLGRAIAVDLAAAGARVFATDIDSKQLASLKSSVADLSRFETAVVDAADRDRMLEFGQRVFDATGGVDAIIANAAMIFYAPVGNFDEARVDRMLGIGIKGALWAAQLLQTFRRPDHPAIWLGMASPVGERGVPGTTVYGMTKAAVASLTRTLAVEFGPLGMRANAIAPGSVPTPGAVALTPEEEYERRRNSIPVRRLGKAEDVAAAVRFLLGDAASYINGEILRVDGGIGAAL